VSEVYAYGSFARDDLHEGSDIDLLVVADYPGRSVDLVGEILRRTDLPVEPLVIRPETLRRRLADGHPLLTAAWADALPLCGPG
jgi:predicted nucleotidyltransferase